jgi:hypothetical protein
MIKDQVMIYKNRWKLLAETEKREIREAPPELLLKQTFSIWKIASSLGFLDRQEQPDRLWSRLQKKWIRHHA